MTKHSFTVKEGEITGYQSGSSVPPGGVEVTQDDLDAYRSARNTIRAEGDSRLPQWDGASVVIPEDTRTLYRVTAVNEDHAKAKVPVIDADGIDVFTFTIERMADATTVQTSFQDELVLRLMNDEPWRCKFTDGVAVKALTSKEPGRFYIVSERGHRLVAPLVFLAAR
jgi:hypothetical protein